MRRSLALLLCALLLAPVAVGQDGNTTQNGTLETGNDTAAPDALDSGPPVAAVVWITVAVAAAAAAYLYGRRWRP